MNDAKLTTIHAKSSEVGEVVLDTHGQSPSEFSLAYSQALNRVLMLVFANAQMELDEMDMVAIRDVMDLNIQLQHFQRKEAS